MLRKLLLFLVLPGGHVAAAQAVYSATDPLVHTFSSVARYPMKYWHAITLANKQQVPTALALLKFIFQQETTWLILIDA